MNTILYGIPNCDTVKKALHWLRERGRNVAFHDFKRGGVPPDLLDQWLDALGWEAILNRKGTTWRRLDEPARAAVVDRTSAKALMIAQPSIIKRPIVAWPDGSVSVGFDPEVWKTR